MTPADFAVIVDHLYWMRDRILESAEAPGVRLVDPAPPTTRDLRATLVHELDVEWSWRGRLRGPNPTIFLPDDVELDPVDFSSISAIRERWSADEGEMRAWIAGLGETALNGPCRAEMSGSHPLWFHLQHLYTHAIQQFSDAATLLSAMGHSPGGIEFLDFLESGAATTQVGQPRPQ